MYARITWAKTWLITGQKIIIIWVFKKRLNYHFFKSFKTNGQEWYRSIIFDQLFIYLFFFINWYYASFSFLPFFREAFILEAIPKENFQWIWNQRSLCFYHTNRYFIASIKEAYVFVIRIDISLCPRVLLESNDLKIL